MQKFPVVLISFHNQKALGVRYLDKALRDAGFECVVVHFKEFNSVNPTGATEKEMELLCQVLEQVQPGLIGLSVMSSLYLDTVKNVNRVIRERWSIPIVWGGVYATLFPEDSLEYCDFIIRGGGGKGHCGFSQSTLQRECTGGIG